MIVTPHSFTLRPCLEFLVQKVGSHVVTKFSVDQLASENPSHVTVSGVKAREINHKCLLLSDILAEKGEKS